MLDKQEELRRLKARIQGVNERIHSALMKSGRNGDDITVVAVSKSVDAAVIAKAADLGLRHFGENRPQVLAQKHRWMKENRPDLLADIHWHMIGHLQRNKAKICVDHCSLIHSLDSVRLAEKLDQLAASRGKVVAVLAQIKISDDETKQGVESSRAIGFVEELSRFNNLQLKGLMGMASYSSDQNLIRREFAELKLVSEGVAKSFVGDNILSMGMSADYDIAIEEGASHVRVGNAIFSDQN